MVGRRINPPWAAPIVGVGAGWGRPARSQVAGLSRSPWFGVLPTPTLSYSRICCPLDAGTHTHTHTHTHTDADSLVPCDPHPSFLTTSRCLNPASDFSDFLFLLPALSSVFLFLSLVLLLCYLFPQPHCSLLNFSLAERSPSHGCSLSLCLHPAGPLALHFLLPGAHLSALHLQGGLYA